MPESTAFCPISPAATKAWRCCPIGPRRTGAAQSRLRRHIFALLERFVGADRPSTLGRILVHELMHPARSGESVFAETLKTELERVRGALRQIAGPDVPESDIEHAALGVLGQCVLYLYARNPDAERGRDFCKSVARRITAFSLGGLDRLRAPVVGE